MVTAARALCRTGFLLMILLLPGLPSRAEGRPPLTHGINITGWFRFPVSRQPATLAAYLSAQALADLRDGGFDFVRLAVDPDVVADPVLTTVLIESIARIERQGLSVVVSPHPGRWRLEHEPQRLRQFWRDLAPRLQPLDPARTVVEVVNEPVFANEPEGWAKLQHLVLGDIRAALPHSTVVLTGADWGSIRGLLALTPEEDPNVLYSFHFYDPPELTSLAAFRPELDRAVMARLPFPGADRASCVATADATQDEATRDLVRYYCSFGWIETALRTPIEQAAAWAREHHVRLFAGEFGASSALNAPARLAWFRTVRGTFAAHDIPWALWGYDDVMGFDVPRPPPARPRLNPAVLAAIGLSKAK
jgi:endoglucanase